MKTLHLLGLPHTRLTRDTVVCAFTAKAHKFVEMMRPHGYRIVAYWGDETDIPEDDQFQHVPVFTAEEHRRWFGDVDANVLPTLPVWDGGAEHWQITNLRMASEMKRRVEPQDLILSLAGYNHQVVTRMFPGVISCEWAAGYSGWCEPFVCFESYAWMHHCYGVNNIHDGRWYDTVIPNFFRPREFQAGPGGDYLLYVGRLIARKGLTAVAAVAREAGLPLVVAGSGAASYEDRRLVTMDGCVLEDVDYAGPVGAARRNELMGGALATVVATTYIEPFGAVAVESQLCGTPVLTTDWGAFPETVVPGVGGYRFRTLQGALDALSGIRALDREQVRRRALEAYSLEAIGPRYDEWFRNLFELWADGWYTRRRG